MTISTEKPIAVIAIGGNALAPESGGSSMDEQAQAAQCTVEHIIKVIQQGWRVVLTHGNGPQVGHILRRSELAAHEIPPEPMSYAIADTQGSIGIMFQKNLFNYIQKIKLNLNVATVVTQVVVDAKDPAFQAPSKPIGSTMNHETATRLAQENGWSIMEETGRGWRRCVASPTPHSVVEINTIRALLENNHLVIACGGGGIPVIQNDDHTLATVDAVIDKDLASALLAKQLDAKSLLIATAVPQVAINFGKPDEKWLDHLTVSEAKRYMAEGHFGKGSMAPKVQAVLNYVEERAGYEGIITDIPNMGNALAGKAGTRIGD